jgi:AraC-like DNA-binding protein
MFQCRYAGAPRGPQYEQWREEFGRKWLSADFGPVDGEYLVSEFRGSEHSFLGLCMMRGSPLHAMRRDDAANHRCDHLFWIVASGSCLQTRQRGRSNDLHLGQMALMSAGEPARVTQTMKGSRWSIRIARKRLNDLCRSFDDKVAQPVTASRELTKLLLHQIETAHRFGSKLGPAANHAMAQHILDLVGLCLGADKDAAHAAEQRGLAAARLDAIKADILHALGTSDLDLERVASRHRVSPRYVQHLFERAGTSFTSFVLEQRLRLAHRLLGDPINRWRKVSDIAAVSGFCDISYFNRAFRARFGATPTEVRTGSRSLDVPAADDDQAAPPLAPFSVVSQ